MGNDLNSNNKALFKSFIPKYVPNETALKFFNILRKASKGNKNKFPNNLPQNLKNFGNHKKTIAKNQGFIEDQHSYTDMNYGNKTLNYCGCAVIATYNAIFDLTGNKEISLPILIDYFENDGIVLSGMFGTAPTAIEDFFVNQGFETGSTIKEEEYFLFGQKYDSFIFTFYVNKNNILNQVHVVNISKKNQKFYVHNNGGNSYLIQYNSILDFIKRENNGKSKGIFLIGIKKQK